MNITSVSPALGSDAVSAQAQALLSGSQQLSPGAPTRDPAELARQFEAILVRQMLSESMKTLIDGPKGQQSYGYFISEALADGITRGGGMGLRSVIEAQLRGQAEARQAAEERKQSFTAGGAR
jgi:Rod binding domain-containing protein